MSENDYELALDKLEIMIDGARANYIISGYSINITSNYMNNTNKQEFSRYLLADETSNAPIIDVFPYNGILKCTSDDNNRVALIITQKLLAYSSYYLPNNYGEYDVDTYEAVLEARSNWYSLGEDDDGFVDFNFILTLLTNTPADVTTGIDTSFWKYVRGMRLYHNAVEYAATAKILLGTDNVPTVDDNNNFIKMNEVTIKGGGILTNKPGSTKVTPGYADILLQYDKGVLEEEYSRVWEVKSSGVKDRVGINQLQRYLNAAKNFPQDFNTPLLEGYNIGNFIIPGPNEKYIVVYNKQYGKLDEDIASGTSLIFYEVCDSPEEAKEWAFDNLKQELEVQSEAYEPAYEPNIVYEVTPLDLTTVAKVAGVVIIAGVVYFAAPVETIAGAASGLYYLYEMAAYA